MIELYTASTFNGQRVSIMLEDTGLEYSVHKIDLMKGEQRQSDYLKLNPHGKIPAIVDHDSDSPNPVVLTQSVAILQYLAEKTGQFLPELQVDRAKVYQWMQFHAVDIGSMMFHAFYLQQLVSPNQAEAAKILRKQVHALYRHFDQQLAQQTFIAGSSYSIADITALPAVISQQHTLSDYPNLSRWVQQLKQRPAVQRGMAIPKQEVSHAN